MIIDTHCHYNMEPLLTDVQKHWQNSLDHAVIGAICVGTNLETSALTIKLAQKFPKMFAAIGIHPEEHTQTIKSLLVGDTYSQEELAARVTQESEAFHRLLIDALNQKNSKLVAVGEIGLDYFRLKTKGLKRQITIQMQKQLFAKQLALAFKYSLPVILHVRDQADRTETNAYYDTYEIVSNLVSKYKKINKPIPAVILHCASGPKEYIQNFLQMGAYIGFAGNVTYDTASDLREIFEMTPKDRVLLETDAPFLAPNEKKGQLCEPYYIVHTAQFLQDKYHLDLDTILKNTHNAFPAIKM